MLYIILGFGIIFLISFVYCGDDFIIAFCNGCLGIFFGFFVWAFFGGMIGLYLPTEVQFTEQKLYALNDGSNTEGNYFLISGYVDEELIYKYIVETEKGFHMETINIENVYINETNGQPVMREYFQKFKDNTYWWIASPIYLSAFDYVEFHIPKGSVINEYNIDLQ